MKVKVQNYVKFDIMIYSLKTHITTFVVLIIVSLFLNKPIMAQSYFGVATGVNFSNAQKTGNDGWITNDRTVRMTYRAYFDIQLKGKWSLQPEVNFIQKAYHRAPGCPSGPGFGFYNIHKINYLNLNMLVKYDLTRSSNQRRKSKSDNSIRYYSLLGLYGGGGVSGKLFDKCDDSSEPYDFDKSDSTDARRGNFGALAGLGVVLSTYSVEYFIETRYGHDIIPVNGNPFASKDGKIRNTLIALELGIQIRI